MSKEITITATVDLTIILSGDGKKRERKAVVEELENGIGAFKAKFANNLKDYIDYFDEGDFDNIVVHDVKVFERDE